MLIVFHLSTFGRKPCHLILPKMVLRFLIDFLCLILEFCTFSAAWLITDGLASGSTKEIGEIFQESKVGDHANNMSVIGVAPWGIITGRDDIAKHGIGVGFCSTTAPVIVDSTTDWFL